MFSVICPKCGELIDGTIEKYTIDFCEQQIAYWKTKRDEFEDAKIEEEESEKQAQRNANTKRLLEQIKYIVHNNYVWERIYKQTKTLAVIDNFLSSSLSLMIVWGQFWHDKVPRTEIGLIISKVHSDINMLWSDYTMTDLKQMVESCFPSSNQIEKYKNERSYELLKLVDEALAGKNLKRQYIPFSIPFQFKAQGSKNRQGYGNEYWGEDLVHEGTYYGDTTTFAIVGIALK